MAVGLSALALFWLNIPNLLDTAHQLHTLLGMVAMDILVIFLIYCMWSGSNFARLVLGLITVSNASLNSFILIARYNQFSPTQLATTVNIILHVAILYYLFNRNSEAWFRTNRHINLMSVGKKIGISLMILLTGAVLVISLFFFAVMLGVIDQLPFYSVMLLFMGIIVFVAFYRIYKVWFMATN